MNKTKIKFILLIWMVFQVSNDLFSQVTQQWVSRYNGGSIDWGISMAVDADNNIYVVGQSSGIDWDYATVKYNSSGEQQWVARYNGAGNYTDYAYCIAAGHEGDVYVTGWGYFGTGTREDWATVKYNRYGVQQWVARYDGPGNRSDAAYAIVVDQFDNIFVAGSGEGVTSGWDCIVVKYNTFGIQQWAAIYNGPANGFDEASSVVLDVNGNVYVSGGSTGNGSGRDVTTVKYNASGVQQWVARYNGTGNGADWGRSISVDQSGNVFVTGVSYGSSTGYDFVTIKYNSLGVQQWIAQNNGSANGDDLVTTIFADQNGNVYVSGWGKISGSGTDYITIKYNSNGAQQWLARYNGTGNGDDEAFSMTHDATNNIYVTGRSTGVGTHVDYATVKYNSSGVQQWVMRYNDTSNGFDQANSIVIDGNGSVYVTGNERNTEDDFATVKYSQSIGIQIVSTKVPQQYLLQQNYPNPFNPATTIRFALPVRTLVSIIVYDELGREVDTLVNEMLNAGTYETEWNSEKFSSGIYFYKLTASDYTATRKMVVVK